MADCAKYRELVSGYADGELTEAEKTELNRHLQDCASCRALLAVYREIHADIDEFAVELPEGFSAGVMQKIKALGDNAVQSAPSGHPENAAPGDIDLPEVLPLHTEKRKTRNATRTMVITLVAAAACLALVFVVSPQIFLGGSRTSSTAAETKMMYDASASAAPSVAFDAAAPAPAAGSGQVSMKTADGGAEHSNTGTVPAADSTFGTLIIPAATGGPMASSAPSASAAASSAPAASPVPVSPDMQTASSPVPSANLRELSDYSAVITIKGPLPDFIASNVRAANSNGTFNIEVTNEQASLLTGKGFLIQPGNPEKKTALVIYIPS